ncbi:cytochrome b5-like heme/steroid binding domain-protein [Lipomyces japonicus]|uniref:cytochrome b5-like heme/steroid binding domain-protein n=1 Tax=Lipomyces japonicus TaxID=56871 RepID=UPI0034CD989E
MSEQQQQLRSRYRREPGQSYRIEELKITSDEEDIDPGFIEPASTVYMIFHVSSIVLVLNFALSYFITKTFFWQYEFKIFHSTYLKFIFLRTVHAVGLPSLIHALASYVVSPSAPILSSTFFTFKYPLNLTDAQLARHDGTDPNLPLYVAVNGSVFDVSTNPQMYGLAGAYAFFTGRDAARAFVTGCFSSDLTYDLRGLDHISASTEIARWQAFFANNPKYWYVGQVIHEPLVGPPPSDCQAPKYTQRRERS